MERAEGEAYIGRVLTVRHGTRHTITRWDHRRRLFTTRNLATRAEGTISARELEDAISDGIVKLEKRRINQ